ncbi:MAG: DMT family transporter [Candidatus Krumholzibacteria bacterium]|nr:DMT family transporter [Candidatus Krumholzibacteria bacterium]
MFFLVFAAVLWGSSFPVITHALRDISPMLFLVLRFVTAFVILAPRFGSWRRLSKLFRLDLFLTAIPNALAFILQYKAQELTTASKTALFVNSSPVFVVIFAALVLSERFRPRQLAATIIAMVGVVVTSTRLDFSGFYIVNKGDVMSVAVGACWALFIIFSRRVVEKYGPLELSLGLYFWTALMAFPFVFLEPLRFSWSGVPAVLYLAAFTTITAYYFYLRGVRSVSSLTTSLIILIEVVVAFLISHVLLSESFSAVETVGVFMVMTGVVLVLERDQRAPGRHHE